MRKKFFMSLFFVFLFSLIQLPFTSHAITGFTNANQPPAEEDAQDENAEAGDEEATIITLEEVEEAEAAEAAEEVEE